MKKPTNFGSTNFLRKVRPAPTKEVAPTSDNVVTAGSSTATGSELLDPDVLIPATTGGGLGPPIEPDGPSFISLPMGSVAPLVPTPQGHLGAKGIGFSKSTQKWAQKRYSIALEASAKDNFPSEGSRSTGPGTPIGARAQKARNRRSPLATGWRKQSNPTLSTMGGPSKFGGGPLIEEAEPMLSTGSRHHSVDATTNPETQLMLLAEAAEESEPEPEIDVQVTRQASQETSFEPEEAQQSDITSVKQPVKSKELTGIRKQSGAGKVVKKSSTERMLKAQTESGRPSRSRRPSAAFPGSSTSRLGPPGMVTSATNVTMAKGRERLRTVPDNDEGQSDDDDEKFVPELSMSRSVSQVDTTCQAEKDDDVFDLTKPIGSKRHSNPIREEAINRKKQRERRYSRAASSSVDLSNVWQHVWAAKYGTAVPPPERNRSQDPSKKRRASTFSLAGAGVRDPLRRLGDRIDRQFGDYPEGEVSFDDCEDIDEEELRRASSQLQHAVSQSLPDKQATAAQSSGGEGGGGGVPRPESPKFIEIYSDIGRGGYIAAATGNEGSGMLLYYLATAVRHLQPRYDDDFVDQLNHYYTTLVLIGFALLVSAKQYVGHPIQCWVPATFTDAMEQYAENFCWIKSTYWIPFTIQIPTAPSLPYHQRGEEVSYYQWVPFILSLQALLFYVPCIAWRGVTYWISDVSLEKLIELGRDCQLVDPEVRHRTIITISRHLEERFRMDCYARNRADNGIHESFCSGGSSSRCGATMTIIYIISKFLYAGNALLQFAVLNHFLGTNDLFFGYHILKMLINDMEWKATGRFPRVTLCDFGVRVLGNVHSHTIQCVLMINMFNEKIFLFLWYWIVIVTIVTFFNIVYWVIAMFWPGRNTKFVRKYLATFSDIISQSTIDGTSVTKFVDDFLRTDGVFMLRMMAVHAGEMTTSEIVFALWTSFARLQRGNYQETEYSTSSAQGTCSEH